MRFMMLVKSDARSESGALPDEKTLTEMGGYNQALAAAGALLAGEGLRASAQGARIRLDRGKVSVVDGPFPEVDELVAGYWIMQAPSLSEAVEWAKRVPFEEGEVEIRPLFGAEDFAADATEKAGGQKEAKQEAGAAAAPGSPPRKPGTTRYLLMIKADRQTEAGVPPDQKVMVAMGALMEEAAAAGALLAGEGLKPTSKSARVRYAGAKRAVIDGPFTESKELIAGFSLVQYASRAEAIDLGKRMLEVHVDWSGLGAGELEVRPLLELSDFPVAGDEQPDGWRRQEERLRGRVKL